MYKYQEQQTKYLCHICKRINNEQVCLEQYNFIVCFSCVVDLAEKKDERIKEWGRQDRQSQYKQVLIGKGI